MLNAYDLGKGRHYNKQIIQVQYHQVCHKSYHYGLIHKHANIDMKQVINGC